MATFDELRASRDRLAARVAALRRALAMGEMLLDRANAELGQDAAPAPETALLLQELNRELKDTEANDVQDR